MEILTISDKSKFVLIGDDIYIKSNMGDGQFCTWLPLPQFEPILCKQRDELKRIFFTPKIINVNGK